MRRTTLQPDPAYAQPLARRSFLAGVAASSIDVLQQRMQRAKPRRADDFVRSVGVCTHLSSEPYRRKFNEVLRCAASIGIRHFRDELRPSDDLSKWRELSTDAGIRAHLLVSPATNTVGEMLQYLAHLPEGTVSAIEGQNEGDSPWFRAQPSAKPNWADVVIGYQRATFTALRRHYAAETLPVLSPSVLDYRPEHMKALRTAAPFCDMVALHAYPQREQKPETDDDYASLAWYLRQERDVFKPGARAMITEIGYSTALSGISQRAAAIYAPRILLHAFSQGIVRTFLYELLDGGRDPADTEQGFGLLTADARPKAAFHALKLLLTNLSDPGSAFEPSPLSLSCRNAPADLRFCSFAKRNGVRYIALWRAISAWDRVERRDVSDDTREITFELTPSSDRIDVLELQEGADWRPVDRAGGHPRLVVGSMVTLVRVG